jgi:chitinase
MAAPWLFLFYVIALILPFVQAIHHHRLHHSHHSSRSLTNVTNLATDLVGRDTGDARCDKNKECADKSCCNGVSGYCGRTPMHCAADVCVSNCNAKAECGVGADIPGAECPLNVCCSQSGYCGTTENFCSSANHCQSNCVQPGPVGRRSGDVRDLVIG